MPPKIKKPQISKKAQPTLSKFFSSTSQGEKDKKNICKDGSDSPINIDTDKANDRFLHINTVTDEANDRFLHINTVTDEADDFQMVNEGRQRKRLMSMQNSLKDEPKIKKKLVESKLEKKQDESVERLNQIIPGPSKSFTKFISNSSSTADKLKKFSLENNNSSDNDSVDSEDVRAGENKMKARCDEERSKVSQEEWEQLVETDIFTNSSQTSYHQDSLNTFDNGSKSNFGKLTMEKSELPEAQQKCSGQSVKLTPLEQQYMDIKEQHPDALLFVECGYKYRFFGEDAETASQILKIFCHKDHNFMTASIPSHRLFVHIRRMVAAGFKVGVVKQTETTYLKASGPNKVGLFGRRLTALYTRSTLIGKDLDSLSTASEEETTSSYSNSYLMCIQEQISDIKGKRHLGIVCVDPATSMVVYDDFLDGSTFLELETRMTHLAPVEILISSQASDSLKEKIRTYASLSPRDDEKVRVEHVPAAEFVYSKAFNTISQFFKTDAESLQAVLGLTKPVVCCLATLSIYLKEFGLENVLTLTRNFEHFSQKNRFMYLSARSLTNLEIFHNSCDGTEKGSLFWFLNNTLSKFGSRMLRSWLSQPLTNMKDIKDRQDAVEVIIRGELNGLDKIKEMLTKAPDLDRGLCTIFHGRCSPVEFLSVTKSLNSIRKELSGNERRVTSLLLQTLLSTIPENLSDIEDFSSQISIEGARSNDSCQLFVDDSLFPVVAKRKEEIKQVESSIQGHRKEVRLTLKQPGLTFITVMQTEFLIEVKNCHLALVPEDWIQISSTKTVSRFHSPFIVENYRKLNELREQLKLDVDTAWADFLRKFSLGFGRYKKAVSSLAMLDCLISLAQTASLGKYCKPQMESAAQHIVIAKSRHPVMEALHDGQDQVVPNDTKLGNEWPRLMLLTGPNMGGKSSYARQVALMCILAQVGSFLPAESACISIMDAIYIRMGANDQIFKNCSTFMVEVQETAEIIKEATGKSLVILDELGRGTSTHDGLAIAYATLDYFVTKCPSLVLFVTHFPTLSLWSEMLPKTICSKHMAFIVNKQMAERKMSSSVTFLYELTQGAANRSYGLNVARIAQLPLAVLERASAKSEEFEAKMQAKMYDTEMFVKLFGANEPEIEAAVNVYINSLHCSHH